MRYRTLLLSLGLATVVAVGACDDDSSSDDDDNDDASTTTSGTAGNTGIGGNGTGGGGQGGGATIPVCQVGCDAASQCATGTGPFDADNYACTDGVCVYTGCKDDAECQEVLTSYVCIDTGFGTKLCSSPCGGPSDCDLGGGLAFDVDNYDCTGGGCVYKGCNSTTECEAVGDGYVCK